MKELKIGKAVVNASESLTMDFITAEFEEYESTLPRGRYVVRAVLEEIPGTGTCCERFYLNPVNFERIRRITGYLVGTLDSFNDAKRAEERDRVKHSL